MALLSWSDRYLIGNATIDAEHKKLFGLINDFHSHWVADNARREIAQVLNQLIRYARDHFQDEERIMAEAGYPTLAHHQGVHESLIDTIFQLQTAYESGDLRLEMATMKFVKSWLIGHILEHDYLFRDFLKRSANAAAGKAGA